MNAHTPGPWEIGPDAEGLDDTFTIWAGPPNGVQAELAGRICVEANANLMTSAPDLLEALKAFRQVLDQDWGDDAIQAGFAPSMMLASAVEKAKAAIAKAEGDDA